MTKLWAETRRRRVAGGVLVGASMPVLIVAGRALGPGPTAFDRVVLRGVRARDPGGRLLGLAQDVTSLGSGPILTLLVVVLAGWLVVRGRVHSAILLAVASEGAGRMVSLVKAIVARPRPELVPHWIAVDDFSYPSAHSADSAAVATMLALLIGRAQPDRAARAYVAGVALSLTAAIGISRVYLAVHWPSDVLAGWSFGAAWSTGWWWAAGPSGARD